MKKITLLIIFLISIITSNNVNSQTTLAFQGFEGTGNDTWSYSLNVPIYNNNSGTDLWTTYTSSLGAAPSGLEGPRTGSTYWVGRDLDNPYSEGVTGDTTPDHFMDYAAIATGGVETKLTIYFDFGGYDSSDYIFYEIFYDNGSDWSSADVRVDVNPKPSDSNMNSAGGTWQEFSTTIPSTAQFVRLRIGAHQNGASDYLGIDDIKLVTTVVSDSTAPVFENSTPSASSTTQTGFTLNADIDEAGSIYYVVVADGAAAPSAAEEKLEQVLEVQDK